MMLLVMNVNDSADSLVTILVSSGPWGEYGSPEESRRLDVIHLMTTYSVQPKALEGWFQYLRIEKFKPIHFNVLHFRVTRDYVLAASFSLVVAVLNYPIREAVSAAAT